MTVRHHIWNTEVIVVWDCGVIHFDQVYILRGRGHVFWWDLGDANPWELLCLHLKQQVMN